MKKRIARLAMLVAIAGGSATTLSCSSMLVREARDSAIAGLGTFVESAATTILGDALGLGG